ncbi:MAG: protein-L-isoaspartate(D-aspartate) O-methyltransferase [Acidobacteriota bacterium]
MAERREWMIRHDLEGRDIRDRRVLAAMRQVPREKFVPSRLAGQAYADHPLPIGEGQTISQPYIVALMTQLAEIKSDDRVLEIGTGSGYQAAVLSNLAREVYTIEIIPALAESARQRLGLLGYANIVVRQGDGYKGWPEKQPFQAIIVTAAPEKVPPELIDELAPGGRLVIPVGAAFELQWLKVLTKDKSGRVRSRNVTPVRFVPMRSSGK